ncbi:hypothetical protein Slin14017_G067120 [Septoria linicola]|nr:hypothetical protein Slin14017_G067120 [Septoria linicola]
MAPRIKLSDSDRILRIITIILFLPSLPFLLVHGIRTAHIFPVLGLVPLFLSSCMGALHLSGKARLRGFNILLDLFIAVFMMAMLIPGWIYLAHNGWYSDSGIVMCGTYGTTGVMAGFCLHSYFVLKEINWRFTPFSGTVCPHCDRQIHVRDGKKQSMAESKDEYQPLTMTDNTAGPSFHDGRASGEYKDESRGRPSTDDETARLV